jgi:hypothetical protein
MPMPNYTDRHLVQASAVGHRRAFPTEVGVCSSYFSAIHLVWLQVSRLFSSRRPMGGTVSITTPRCGSSWMPRWKVTGCRCGVWNGPATNCGVRCFGVMISSIWTPPNNRVAGRIALPALTPPDMRGPHQAVPVRLMAAMTNQLHFICMNRQKIEMTGARAHGRVGGVNHSRLPGAT